MRNKIEVCVCDRCGKREEDRTGHGTYGWGLVWAREPNGGSDGIYRKAEGDDNLRARDVCPECFHQLMAWWQKANQTFAGRET